MTDAAPQLSLRRNFLWTLAGNLSYAACQWGVIVCLAKLGSPEIVGRFGLGLALTAPVIVLSQMNLRVILATDSKQKFGFGEYLALRLILTGVALVLIAGLAGSGGYALETMVVILAVGVGKAIEAIADVYYAWFQQRERMDQLARALMLHGVLALAVVVAVMATVGNLAWAVAGWAAAAGVSLGLYTLPSAWRLAREEDGWRKGAQTSNVAQGLRPRWELRRLTRLTWVALPLGVVTMLISFQVNVPRYYLEAYRGESELGIYTALAHLPAAGNLVMQALGQAASPRLARHHAAGERGAFRRLLLQLLGIGFLFEAIGLSLVVFLGAPLLRLLYTPEYAEHVEMLGLLTVASAISCLAYFVSYAMTAARIFRAQVPLFIAMVLATAAGCQMWVPEYGMRGAAWAAIAAAGVQFVGSALLVVLADRKGLGEKQHEG